MDTLRFIPGWMKPYEYWQWLINQYKPPAGPEFDETLGPVNRNQYNTNHLMTWGVRPSTCSAEPLEVSGTGDHGRQQLLGLCVQQSCLIHQPAGLIQGFLQYKQHLNIATCTWWFPVLYFGVEKASHVSKGGKMYLLRSPVENPVLPIGGSQVTGETIRPAKAGLGARQTALKVPVRPIGVPPW